MVCTFNVKAAMISVQNSKHLVHCNSVSKARKHELDGTCCDMRSLIITEQLTPRRSSSSKKSLWDFSPCEGGSIKHLHTCLLLLFGLLLCFSFILAMCSTLQDAASLRIIHADKSNPEESRLMGFHSNLERFNNLGHMIEHIGHASPTHTHVGDTMKASTTSNKEAAMHGLGVVFSKGTKSMQNLIIANLEESCDMLDFRLFLRTLYRSGAMARADLVLLFPWPSLPQAVSEVLREEDISFKKLLTKGLEFPTTSMNAKNISVFNAHAFKGQPNDAKSTDKKRFIMWGENTTSASHEETHLIDYEYGSVVGFHMNELDSTDGFSEFLINPSSQLRRWLCYQMLLGLLRFKFRLAMLVELGGVVILDDVFPHAKKKDFLYLSLEDSTWADATSATVEYNHSSKQGERPSNILPRGMQYKDHINSLILTNTHDDDTMQIVPLSHGVPGQTTTPKSLDDNEPEHMVHTTMLSNKGFGGGAPKRRHKMHVDNSQGLLVKRRKHEMMDKSTHNIETGDDEGNDTTREKKRMLGRSRQAVGNMGKPNYTRVREQGHVGAKQSLMEMVYGKEVWGCLEQVEKQRRVVSSRVILGSLRSVKGLANTMAVEIVKVALQRESKLSFPDRALLSYLVQKSSHLLGRRASDSLHLMGNGESMVHIVDHSEQRNVFVRAHDGKKYSVVQATTLNVRPKSVHSHQKEQSLISNVTLSDLISADICTSTADAAAFYNDCALQKAELAA